MDAQMNSIRKPLTIVAPILSVLVFWIGYSLGYVFICYVAGFFLIFMLGLVWIPYIFYWSKVSSSKKHGDVDQLIKILERSCRNYQSAPGWNNSFLNVCLEYKALVDLGDISIEPVKKRLNDGREKYGLFSSLLNALLLDIPFKKISDLKKLGESSLDKLAAMLGDNDKITCRAAANALHEMNWTPTNDALGAKYCILEGKYEDCIFIGNPAVEPLIGAFKSDKLTKPFKSNKTDNSMRKEIAYTLGRIGDARAINPLIDAIKHIDTEQEMAYADALVQIGGLACTQLLDRLNARDQKIEIRETIAEILHKINSKEPSEQIASALKRFDDEKTQFVESVVEKLLNNPPAEKSCYIIIREKSNRPLDFVISTGEGIGCFTDRDKAEKCIEFAKQQVGEPLLALGVGSMEDLWAILNYKGRTYHYDPPYGLFINPLSEKQEYSVKDIQRMGFERFKKGLQELPPPGEMQICINEKIYSIDETVDLLLDICQSCPNGILPNSEAEKKVREIGEAINKVGGMKLMRSIHSRFAGRNRWLARSIESSWNGVGQWQA